MCRTRSSHIPKLEEHWKVSAIVPKRARKQEHCYWRWRYKQSQHLTPCTRLLDAVPLHRSNKTALRRIMGGCQFPIRKGKVKLHNGYEQIWPAESLEACLTRDLTYPDCGSVLRKHSLTEMLPRK